MQRTWCAQVTQSRSFKPISGGGGDILNLASLIFVDV